MVTVSVYDIDFTTEVNSLIKVINAFQVAKRSDKPKTEWYLLCVTCRAFINQNHREINAFRIDDIEFAASAARAYSDLLTRKSLTCYNPEAAKKASGYAAKLVDIYPLVGYVPDATENTQFLNELKAIASQNTRKTPPNALTAKGNPAIRWLIYRLAEEYCYSFAHEPSALIIWNLVQIGWPNIDIKTVRYTANDSLFAHALQQANVRRQNANKSIILDQQQKNAENSANNIVKSLSDTANKNPVITNTDNNLSPENTDEAIYKQLKKNAKGLSNRNASFRLISLINSMLESEGYQQDES